MTEDEYKSHAEGVADDIMRHPEKYPTAARCVTALLPDMTEANEVVRLAAQKYCKITARGFETAINARRRVMIKEECAAAKLAHEQEKLTEAQRTFGGEVANAREAVWNYMNHNGITVSADLECRRGSRKLSAELIEGEIMLAAEALGYTLPGSKIMTNGALKLAFTEYLEAKSAEREKAIWTALDPDVPTDPVRGAHALQAFRALADKLFAEPEFGFWALVKVIWQAKRRRRGLHVRDLQMIVLTGEQKTGKTELVRNLIQPLHELATEADAAQVADDKNFTLRQLAMVFVDEFAKAEKVNRNKVKAVITGDAISTRVHHSHRSKKVPIRCTLIGTADRPLHTYITDPAGMRRFVPLQMKRRKDIHIAHWDEEVEALDWAGVWLAVDPNTVDPLMSRFADGLAEKQEGMRLRENVEAWLEQFDPTEASMTCRRSAGDGYTDFAAQALYEYDFRRYEEVYHPASHGTSLTVWGMTMKDLIDTGKLDGWSYHTVSHKMVYRVAHSQQRRDDRRAGNGLVLVQNKRRT